MVGYGDLQYLIQIGVDIISLLEPDDTDDDASHTLDTKDVILDDRIESRLWFLSRSKLELQRSLSTPPYERINNKHLLDVYINKQKHNRRSQPIAIGSFTPQRNRRFQHDETRSLYIMSPGGEESSLLADDSILSLETASNSGSNLAMQNTGLPLIHNFSAHLLHTSFRSRPRSPSNISTGSASILDLDLKPRRNVSETLKCCHNGTGWPRSR